MARVQANGIEIEYETLGRSEDPALLLVMGLGAQLTSWPDGLCEQLVAHSFFVVRFDNRDAGLSTKITDGTTYSLDDMADDAVGLLDALGIDAAHIVGASLGGMIAQTMAVRHPDRVRTLCSIMSATGAPEGLLASNEVLTAFMRPPAATREEAIVGNMHAARVIGSTGFPIDEVALRARAERSYDRAYFPEGTFRQLLAIAASGDRTEALAGVTAPTVVIHGSVDPLIPPLGGELTARAIPGARHVVIDGMGHDLPEGAWPLLVESIVANAANVTT